MHTHILLFGSKVDIILAMYVQMLDMYIENIEKIENIKNIVYFRYFQKYHDIFQPCLQRGLSAIAELLVMFGAI